MNEPKNAAVFFGPLGDMLGEPEMAPADLDIDTPQAKDWANKNKPKDATSVEISAIRVGEDGRVSLINKKKFEL